MTEDNFTEADAFKSAQGIVNKFNLPLPAKPKGDEPEFEIPVDPGSLTGTQLGQLQLRALAWYSYNAARLGQLEAKLIPLEDEYKLRVNQGGNALRAEPTFKNRSGDIIEAEVLARDESLKPLHDEVIKLRSTKALLESREKIYESLSRTMSRELSRREMEARLVRE